MAALHTGKSLLWVISLVMLISMSGGVFNNYNPYYMYGANNYMSAGISNGMWWVQPRCHWGVKGYRSPSLHQCGTFYCPAMWYGSSQFACPPPALFSNSLQKCVHPASLANTRCQS